MDFHMRKRIASDGTTVCIIPPTSRPRRDWGTFTRLRNLPPPAPPSAASHSLPTHLQEPERDESPPNNDDNHNQSASAIASGSRTEGENTPTIHDNPPVMDRQSHHLRNDKEWIIFWYECTTRKRLEALPSRDHFPGIQTNDLFVHWISNMQPRRCQVWVATLEGENIRWESMRWGQLQQGRHFIIRSQGVPSLVEKSTWDRTYRRRSPTIVN